MNAEHIASLYDYVNEGRGDADRITEIDCCEIGRVDLCGDVI